MDSILPPLESGFCGSHQDILELLSSGIKTACSFCYPETHQLPHVSQTLLQGERLHQLWAVPATATERPSSLGVVSRLQNQKQINGSCFKPLSYGVAHYIAKDNWYTLRNKLIDYSGSLHMIDLKLTGKMCANLHKEFRGLLGENRIKPLFFFPEISSCGH